MKHKLIKLLIAIISPTLVVAQFNPGLPAGFGIDGDVLSGQSQNTDGTSPQNSFDWFKKPGGGSNVGYGIIDTTGAYSNGILIAQGKNIRIDRGMAYSRYSTVNGYLLLDGRYVRDYLGTSNDSVSSDKTIYKSGAKNGDNPTTWTSNPAGASLPDKSDIIDAYVHMRRDGTIINNTNPSPLILILGISTISSGGSRFIDFELYRSRINYNISTGNFENSGPETTGGHTEWKFNSDGSTKDIGDISVAFSCGTGGITEIAVYIWISQANYNTVKPKTFNLVPNEYYGGTYGYAKIAPTATSPFRSWGSINTLNTTGPAWGTNSKSLGSSNNFYSNSYGVNDFAEAALDLTSLGIDPALSNGMDPCTPPYTRIMAKTRSSASFTSALQDFVGPTEFLDAPQAPAQIATPQILQCKTQSITLMPATVVAGALYNWNTTNGNITSSTTSTSITVDKPGKYYLSAAIVAGCPNNLDSVTVTQDIYQPIASVYVGGKIDINNPLSTVTLNGGDVNLSNFATPFGGSVGLTWKWTGPNGFTSNSRNNNVNKLGTYTLELTEERNGCKDTAYDVVEPLLNLAVLPIKLGDFSAVKKDNNKVAVQWQDFDQTPHTLELQRSFNGMNFFTIYTTKNNNNTLLQNYRDDISSRTGEKIFYKLKSTSLSGDVAYSKIIYLNYTDNGNSDLIVFPTVVKSFTNLVISCEQSTNANIQFLDLGGKMILQTNVSVDKGRNHLVISDLDKLKSGMYLVKVIVNSTIQNKKIIKE